MEKPDRAMRVLLLAAGWASRLGEHAEGRPKPLLALGRTTAVDVCTDRVDALAEVEAIDVWTNEHFRPSFEAWASQRRTRAPLRVLGNRTRSAETRLGAVGDIAAYLERVGPSGPLLVIAADSVFDGPLDALASACRTEVSVVLHDVGSPAVVSRFASVECAPDGRILHLREKDPRPVGTVAATALYGLPTDAFGDVARYVAEGGSVDSMGSILEWWVPRRVVRGLVLPGRWIDVGHPDELAKARQQDWGPA